MEELAKQQLSATKDMAAAINSLADRTGLGLAATKAAGTGLKAGKAIAGAIKEIPGENLSAKNIAKGVDETLDTLGNAIHQYAETGKVTADLGGILTNFGSFVKNEMTTAFSNVEKQANEISKAFPVLADITKSIQRATGTLPSTSSTIPRGTTSTNSAGGTQSNNPSTVDVNLNVKVDSNSPNIDSKQMEQIMTNPALMEKLTLGIKDGLSKMTPVKKQ